MALNMVFHAKLRSWLTILGIVIGVASVISIVGIGSGMNQQMMDNMGTLEADIITITPGYSRAQGFSQGQNRENPFRESSSSSSSQKPLTDKDVQALRGINNVALINTQISGQVDLTYLGEKGKFTVTGVNQKVYAQITSTKISDGRMLSASDSNVILIGKQLASSFFEKEIKVGQLLTIEGRNFRVVGIIDEANSRAIIMPIDAAFEVLKDSTKGEYGSIIVKIKDADKLNETESEIQTKLLRSRNLNKDKQDFSIRTNSQSNSMREEMTSTLTTFLTAIASVSLIVGAVGIANTMFTAVLEKTKDIGIMKSIGARNEDILIIFLLNAGFIGLVGGAIGVMFGYILSFVLTAIGLTSVISIKIVFMTLAVAIMVGMISGFIPAINASKLNPVEALRRD